MDYVDTIYRVMNQIILRKYPEILGLRVKEMGMGNFFKLTYDVKRGTLSPEQAVEIMNETSNLFRIIGIEGPSDIIVDFKTHE